jgi:hypothetical protein
MSLNEAQMFAVRLKVIFSNFTAPTAETPTFSTRYPSRESDATSGSCAVAKLQSLPAGSSLVTAFFEKVEMRQEEEIRRRLRMRKRKRKLLLSESVGKEKTDKMEKCKEQDKIRGWKSERQIK